jgi:hypothetical protein
LRKIIFQGHADTVGTDTAEIIEFPDDATDKEISDCCDDWGHEMANMWDRGDYEEEGYETYEEGYDDFLQQCGWWWEEYEPEKHDGLLI